MDWSSYQKDFFSSVVNSNRNIFLEAVAGSGKTTVVVEGVKRLKGQRIFCAAFGRRDADRLDARIGDVAYCDTMNRFGYHQCRDYFGRCRVVVDKVKRHCERLGFDNWWNIRKVVDLCKANLNNDPFSMAEKYYLDFEEELLRNAGIVFDATANDTSCVDLTDQYFLPVWHKAHLRTFDTVIVDEAQDLSPCQIELIRMIKPKRVIFVGDRFQAVYGWRGADVHAVETIQDIFETEQMPLSICYRCPRRVIEMAQEIVPHIQYAPGAPLGIAEDCGIIDYRENVRELDVVLCRTNAPLVKECFQQIKLGKRAYVEGKELHTDLVNLVEELGGYSQDFAKRLDNWMAREAERLEHRPFILQRQEEKHEILSFLFEESKDKLSFNERMRRIFDSKQDNAIRYMTIHKAKGSEANRVWAIATSKVVRAEGEDQVQQEMNLKYVLITRAQKELRLVP